MIIDFLHWSTVLEKKRKGKKNKINCFFYSAFFFPWLLFLQTIYNKMNSDWCFVFCFSFRTAYRGHESLHLMRCQHFNTFDHPICFPTALLIHLGWKRWNTWLCLFDEMLACYICYLSCLLELSEPWCKRRKTRSVLYHHGCQNIARGRQLQWNQK